MRSVKEAKMTPVCTAITPQITVPVSMGSLGCSRGDSVATSPRAASAVHSPAGKTFVNMYKAAEGELLKVLQLEGAAAAAPPPSFAAAGADALAQLLSPCSDVSYEGGNVHLESLGAEGFSDKQKHLGEEAAYYAGDEALGAAVGSLCAHLLARNPLAQGTASAAQHCRDLEAEVACLEQEVSGKGSPAARRAANKRLAAVMDLKCLECDLVCTLLEQHAAAEDLTAGGPATFQYNWHNMLKLEGRVGSLRKQLSQQHGVQVVLEPFPQKAAVAVLALATSADAKHHCYLSCAWKVLQRVNCSSSSSLLMGLQKSSSLPGRLLALKLGSSRRSKSQKQ